MTWLRMNTIAVHQANRWFRVRQGWQTFWSIYGALNRRQDLRQLIDWAARKGLPGPLACYRKRLEDDETRLMNYSVRTPHLVRWAWRVYWLKRTLIPGRRYYAQGSAARYARCQPVSGRR